MQLFGERFGNFVAAAIAIPVVAVLVGYPTMLALSAADMRRDAGAIGGFYVRGAAAKQGVTLAAAEPLAYVRDEDHGILIGPLLLSAAKAKASECCDPDEVEVITQDTPAYALVDEEAKERLRPKVAARDK